MSSFDLFSRLKDVPESVLQVHGQLRAEGGAGKVSPHILIPFKGSRSEGSGRWQIMGIGLGPWRSRIVFLLI